MYTVYALYSRRYEKVYVGYTSDLEGRMLSHNVLGHKGWTIRYRPWEVFYTEVYDSKDAAMKREKWLKSGVGRSYLREKLEDWKRGATGAF